MGFVPCIHYDWEARKPMEGQSSSEKLNQEEAQRYATRIYDAWIYAKSQLFKAQQRQSTQTNKKRIPKDFGFDEETGIGDLVYITKRTWRTDRPSDKLDNPVVGLFRIIGKKGYGWEVQLPVSYKVHNVFRSDRLRKALSEVLPGQLNRVKGVAVLVL